MAHNGPQMYPKWPISKFHLNVSELMRCSIYFGHAIFLSRGLSQRLVVYEKPKRIFSEHMNLCLRSSHENSQCEYWPLKYPRARHVFLKLPEVVGEETKNVCIEFFLELIHIKLFNYYYCHVVFRTLCALWLIVLFCIIIYDLVLT